MPLAVSSSPSTSARPSTSLVRFRKPTVRSYARLGCRGDDGRRGGDADEPRRDRGGTAARHRHRLLHDLPPEARLMREILPGVLHWTVRHPNIGSDVSSYWLKPERVVLNPLLPPEGLEAFAEDPPAAVLLTNRHHRRDSERFGVPIHAPAAGLHDVPGAVGFAAGDEPVPGVRAREIGSLSDDEFALIVPRARAVAVADGVIRRGADAPLSFVPDFLMGD